MDAPMNAPMGERVYRAEEITGADESVAGRLWLSEEEALSLSGSDREITIEDPGGRRIRGRIVGETPEQVEIEKRPDGQVLVKFIGHYL